MSKNLSYKIILNEIKKGNVDILRKYKREVYDLDSDVKITIEDIKNIFVRYLQNQITISDLSEWVSFNIGSTAISYAESDLEMASEVVFIIDEMVDTEDLEYQKDLIEKIKNKLDIQ